MRRNPFDDNDDRDSNEDPFRDLFDQMRRIVDELNDEDFGGPTLPDMDTSRTERESALEVREHGDEVIVVADVPGFSEDDLDVTIEENRVRVEGNTERAGRERIIDEQVTVDEDIDVERANAELSNGVLTVHLPHEEEEDEDDDGLSITIN